MTAGPRIWDDQVVAERERAGHGSGEGPQYVPWLFCQEVSNSDTQTRIYSDTVGRTVHLLSDVCRAMFLSHEADTDLHDYRESYPLPRWLSTRKAAELGLRHSKYPRSGAIRVLTISAMVKYREGQDSFREEAWDAISVRQLRRRSVQNQLAVRRACCDHLGIKHFVFTEEMLTLAAVHNLESIRGARQRIGEMESIPGLFERHPQAMLAAISDTRRRITIADFCRAYDRREKLPDGTGIRIFKLLLWSHQLTVDVNVPDFLQQPLPRTQNATAQRTERSFA